MRVTCDKAVFGQKPLKPLAGVPTSVTLFRSVITRWKSGVVDNSGLSHKHAHLSFGTIQPKATGWNGRTLNPGTVTALVVVNIDAYDALSDARKTKALDGSVLTRRWITIWRTTASCWPLGYRAGRKRRGKKLCSRPKVLAPEFKSQRLPTLPWKLGQRLEAQAILAKSCTIWLSKHSKEKRASLTKPHVKRALFFSRPCFCFPIPSPPTHFERKAIMAGSSAVLEDGSLLQPYP